MSIKCSVFIATSLDGFIARRNGDIDWLRGSDGMTDGEDYGFGEFFASVDTLIMGRHTYELVLTFREWPYRGRNVVVMSRDFPRPLTNIADGVQATSASPEELIQHLAANGCSHAYVDGGKTVQSFLRANLIQELTITTVPVLIGEGIPLFGPLPRDVQLQHVSTTSFDSGFVQTKYEVRQ